MDQESNPITQEEPDISWMNPPNRTWWVAVLILLLLAFTGPWTFDLIMVPKEYACSAPFIRLEGDYCGTPLSGLWILSAVAGEFISLVVRLATGATTLANSSRMSLISLLFLLPPLPLMSTLLLILPGNHPGKLTFHLAAWGLAAASALGVLLFAPELPASQLWGVWLYVGLAPSVLILEVIALVLSKRSSQA